VPGRDVSPDLAGAILLEMNMEGGEWTIIASERFARTGVRAFVVEFHSRGCSAPDPETGACDLLGDTGDTVHVVSATDPGVGTLWAYRK
jgi:hypothetical protein